MQTPAGAPGPILGITVILHLHRQTVNPSAKAIWLSCAPRIGMQAPAGALLPSQGAHSRILQADPALASADQQPISQGRFVCRAH